VNKNVLLDGGKKFFFSRKSLKKTKKLKSLKVKNKLIKFIKKYNIMKKTLLDVRFFTLLLVIWGVIFTLILFSLTNEKINFIFGPSENRMFLSININTWQKWIIIALLVMIDKFINSLGVDIIGSWLSHTIADHKTTILPYSKNICYIISNVYSFYYNIRYIITLQLLISQIDFALLRVLSDVIATQYSTYLHIKEKKYKKE